MGRERHYYRPRLKNDTKNVVFLLSPEEREQLGTKVPWHSLTVDQKKKIRKRHHYQCAYCKQKSDYYHYDRIDPNGTFSEENVAYACSVCAVIKDHRNPDEWGKPAYWFNPETEQEEVI